MQLLEHQYCRQHLVLEKQKQREPLEPSSCSQDILATRGQQLTRAGGQSCLKLWTPF